MSPFNRTILATSAAAILGVSASAAVAQSGTQTNQDRLGAVVGALFGDRLGLSAMDQAWLRGGRPLSDGQSQFATRVDASVRSGAVSSAAGTKLRADYASLVDLERQYSAGGITTQERTDLSARYNALIQTLDSGAAGYGETANVAAGRTDFERRVDAAVTARRITRTQATQLKTDYQAVIQLETRYQADGVISASERADLDARLDALDARVGDGPAGQAATANQTPAQRLTALQTSITTAENASRITRAEAADIRVALGDLQRLNTAYGRYAASSDDTAYLTRRIGELEARVNR